VGFEEAICCYLPTAFLGFNFLKDSYYFELFEFNHLA